MTNQMLWTNCHFEGPPPKGFADWHEWARVCSEAGITSGVRIQALESSAEPTGKRGDGPITKEEVDRYLAEGGIPLKPMSPRSEPTGDLTIELFVPGDYATSESSRQHVQRQFQRAIDQAYAAGRASVNRT